MTGLCPVSPEAARALAKRLRLQRSRSNDGKTLLSVDLAEIQHTPKPTRSPAGHRLDKGKIQTLQAEIAKLKELAAGHRTDFERVDYRWRPRIRHHAEPDLEGRISLHALQLGELRRNIGR